MRRVGDAGLRVGRLHGEGHREKRRRRPTRKTAQPIGRPLDEEGLERSLRSTRPPSLLTQTQGRRRGWKDARSASPVLLAEPSIHASLSSSTSRATIRCPQTLRFLRMATPRLRHAVRHKQEAEIHVTAHRSLLRDECGRSTGVVHPAQRSASPSHTCCCTLSPRRNHRRRRAAATWRVLRTGRKDRGCLA
jgi:hypothetical protein